MMYIRPVSDLRNKYPEIEDLVVRSNEPVYLTKNGYGSMVLLSIEKYRELTDRIELNLAEAEGAAENDDTRYIASEVYDRMKKVIHE